MSTRINIVKVIKWSWLKEMRTTGLNQETNRGLPRQSPVLFQPKMESVNK